MGAGCEWLLSGDATGTEINFFKADERRVLDGRLLPASDGVLVSTTEGAVGDGLEVGIPEGAVDDRLEVGATVGAADDKVGVGTTVEVGTAVGSSVG